MRQLDEIVIIYIGAACVSAFIIHIYTQLCIYLYTYVSECVRKSVLSELASFMGL